MKLAEIATRINAHLKRFESDPKINRAPGRSVHPYFYATAWSAGRFVYVQYVSFQGHPHLTRAEAEKYLAWLDAGNVGRHYEALR